MENPIVYIVDSIIGTCRNMFGYRINEKSFKIVLIFLTILHLSYEDICGDLNSGCFIGARLTKKDIPLTTFQLDGNKPQYYRYLYIDEVTSSLFVGAKNNLIKLNLTDISVNSKSVSLLPVPQTQSVCNIQFTQPDYCENHIRYILRINVTEIFACGTGADLPLDYTVTIESNGDLNVQKKVRRSDNKDIFVCQYDPFDNSTAIYIENGSPGDVPAVYTGVISQYKTPYIMRPTLMKDGVKVIGMLQNPDNMIWLNEPQFVGSFEVGSEVLFFFREAQIESPNKIISRVAKVCKSDKGGSSVLVNKWTTYQKARLNCFDPEGSKIYFDEIQDVVMYNNTFYALFISNTNGAAFSAICAYKISAIQKTFDGEFRNQSSGSPIPSSKVPSEAGKCVNNSLSLVDEVERFMTVNPIMFQEVQQQYNEPMFIMKDVLMQKLAIDANESYDNTYVFFTGSNSGEVFKLRVEVNRVVNSTNEKPQGFVATRFSVLNKEPVWAMKLDVSKFETVAIRITPYSSSTDFW